MKPMIKSFESDELSLLEPQLLGQSESHLICPDNASPKLLIHKDMQAQYQAMKLAASKDDIVIAIASGFRSFDRQLAIFNNKFLGNTPIKDSENNTVNIEGLADLDILHAILLYSALPGASRHHWGCDIDVFAPNLLSFDAKLQLEPWEYQVNGPMYKLSLWLDNYASDFNFYRPYESYQGGVAPEPWHLSYKPVAQIYEQAFSLATLENALKHASIEAKDTIIANLSIIAQRYINTNFTN